MNESERYSYYEKLVDQVQVTIEAIRRLDRRHIIDAEFLERTFIPSLGLNNEMLNEQPPELGAYFGKGLHLWQYPNQLSKYLVWLSYNARSTKRYMEVGCRWGGTFILITEWLKKIGAPLEMAIAVDPIDPSPFIRKYVEVSDIPVHYLRDLSTSARVKDYYDSARPDMVFIDGDHSIEGVMLDHLLVRKAASIIVHHDIMSQACPGTTLFWKYVRSAEDSFDAFEFVDQYPSVGGSYLGIGVLKRK